jgi:uncharacterized membrane protein
MNFKLSLLIVLIGIMIVFLGVNAQAMPLIEITSESNDLSLEAGNSINVMLNIKNNGTEKECIELFTKTYSDELKAVLATNNVCVSPNQTVKFSLSVFAEINADETLYLIDVFAEQGTIQLTKTSLNVDVYKTSVFEINTKNSRDVFYKDGYTKFVKVIVTNLGSGFQKINLTADSEMFVPSFNPSTVHLNAFESTEVEMQININNSTPAGNYEIPMYAESLVNGRNIQRSALIELKEKNELHEPKFELNVIDEFTAMNRNEIKFIKFEVINLLNEKQKIKFMLNSGGLDAELMQLSTELNANESEVFYIKVYGHEYYKAKEFQGIIWAYNDKEQLQDSFIINIKAEHKVTAKLLNNDLKAKICSINGTEFFEIELINSGDFDELIKLELNNPYNDVQVVSSKNNFELEKGKTEIIRIIVNPGFNSLLGKKEITAKIYAGKNKINSFNLKFVVVPDDSFKGLDLETMKFVSYPKEINLKQGEIKKIEVTITNTGNETITGLIEFNLKGIDYGLSSETETIYTLIPGETKKISLNLLAEENARILSFNAVIEAKHEKYATVMPVRINLSESETQAEQEETGFIAGLIGLGGSVSGGIIVLIVLSAIILLISLLSSEKPNKYVVYEKRRGMYA